jgi:predicted aminopeptidase
MRLHSPITCRASGAVRTALTAILLCALPPMLAGCGTLSYYSYAVAGQLRILHARQPLEAVLADPGTPQHLRDTLELVREITRFAREELLLPDNGSYSSYVETGRRYVAWNVFATPEFSVEPLHWCYPFAGCMSYRGYFDELHARRDAEQLASRGYDVYVGGVPAYSTLGWFSDPILDTMLHGEPAQLARVIFHELAHQRIYFRDDTDFNEAFADAVAIIGIDRWLTARADADGYRAELEFENRFISLVLDTKEALRNLYATSIPEMEMRRRKSELIAELRIRYIRLKTESGNRTDFDGWFAGSVNNAGFAAISTYRELVPAFLDLFEISENNLELFYAQLEQLKSCGKDARRLRLLRRTTDPC